MKTSLVRSTRSFRHIAHLVFVASAGILCTGSAVASPILETHTDSLTTYLGAATSVQGVLPSYLQRGVFLDGSIRSSSPFGWSIAGNPFGEPVSGSAKLGSISLATGTYEVTETDLAALAGERRVGGGAVVQRRAVVTDGVPQQLRRGLL